MIIRAALPYSSMVMGKFHSLGFHHPRCKTSGPQNVEALYEATTMPPP